MNEAAILRLLDLVRRELGAEDARLELGRREPDDARTIWCRLTRAWRVVAIMPTPALDKKALLERLEMIVHSFEGITADIEPQSESVTSGELARRRLDDALQLLAERAGAISAVVVDAQSPVVWGTSELRRSPEDVDSAVETARVLEVAEKAGVDLATALDQNPEDLLKTLEDPQISSEQYQLLRRSIERIRERSGRRGLEAWRQYLLSTRVLAIVRSRGAHLRSLSSSEVVRADTYGYLVRTFASIYHLVLVFDTGFSELHAEAAVLRALPVVERLVMAIPPIEPPPRGAKVVRLPQR